VPRFLSKLWLLSLASLLVLGSSSALTLCVHDSQVALGPSWAQCCEPLPCCAQECEGEEPSNLGSLRDDGCHDYVLALGSEWVPSEHRGECPACVVAWRPLPRASAAQLCPRRLLPPGLLGVPPPVRPQRSSILRC